MLNAVKYTIVYYKNIVKYSTWLKMIKLAIMCNVEEKIT